MIENENVKLICLGARTPQRDSLVLFDKICSKLSLKKNNDLEADIKTVQKLAPTFKGLDGRDFLSLCFSLATGIGKTKLMGMLIAYLNMERGIQNFFIMAPNLTIYNKLKQDFGDPTNEKYVFGKFPDFAINPPRIIDGDNYENFRSVEYHLAKQNKAITINIFNISKLNSEVAKGAQPRIKRMRELLGDSYFNYLVELPDLVLLMDESHHYRAEKGMAVINELKPVLGLELTATPIVGKDKPFENIIYEYGLGNALADGKYVKIPAVVTRRDFNPQKYDPNELDNIKLHDGLQIHNDLRAELYKYARENDKKCIKPFVLVVCKDTTHSKKIYEYMTSTHFYKGHYANKVIEIHSAQKGVEKDENIDKLMSVENFNNPIEIVIHVNMLKEGWDVNNLYTIIPLRASASEVLTHQTIGRGLRLPYGTRTGVDKIDTLNIVQHDNFARILEEAKKPDSIIKKTVYAEDYGKPSDDIKETISLQPVVEEKITDINFTKKIANLITTENGNNNEKTNKIAKEIIQTVYDVTMSANKSVKNINELQTENIKKTIIEGTIAEFRRNRPQESLETIRGAITQVVEDTVKLITDHIIPIPRAVIKPKMRTTINIKEFKLDTTNMSYQALDANILIKELAGKQKERELSIDGESVDTDTPENAIISKLNNSKSDVNYSTMGDVMYQIIEQLKEHLKSYLHDDDKVNQVLRQRRDDIVEKLYEQMSKNFYIEKEELESSEMAAFEKIYTPFAVKLSSDKIYDRNDSVTRGEISQKIFKGYRKSCLGYNKFDSSPEKIFADIMENSDDVIRFLRPATKQFSLIYDRFKGSKYEPDFIVETANKIYMVEIKDNTKLNDEVVIAKKDCGVLFCEKATEFNSNKNGKPWQYAIIPDNKVTINASFKKLITED